MGRQKGYREGGGGVNVIFLLILGMYATRFKSLFGYIKVSRMVPHRDMRIFVGGFLLLGMCNQRDLK